MQPLFVAASRPENLEPIDKAITLVEQAAALGRFEFDLKETLELSDAAFEAAERTHSKEGFHAAEFARQIMPSLPEERAVPRESYDPNNPYDAVDYAFSNLQPEGDEELREDHYFPYRQNLLEIWKLFEKAGDYQFVIGLRSDLELLRSASQDWTDDSPVAPSIFGHLWPDGFPRMWPSRIEAAKAKVAESIAHRLRVETPLHLFFDSRTCLSDAIQEVVEAFMEFSKANIRKVELSARQLDPIRIPQDTFRAEESLFAVQHFALFGSPLECFSHFRFHLIDKFVEQARSPGYMQKLCERVLKENTRKEERRTQLRSIIESHGDESEAFSVISNFTESLGESVVKFHQRKAEAVHRMVERVSHALPSHLLSSRILMNGEEALLFGNQLDAMLQLVEEHAQEAGALE